LSVRLFVRLMSRSGTDPSPGQIETKGFHHMIRRFLLLSTNSSTRMVADRHRLAANHNKHCWRAFRGYQHRWPWTTLNRQNMGFSEFFAILGCDVHLRVNFRGNYLR